MDGLTCPRSCERRAIVGSGDGRMQRRRARELEQALFDAQSPAAKALAHFRFSVFHDNNGREAEAIPHYRAALQLGLPKMQQAQALAWLASSYWKVGRTRQALRCIEALRHRRLSAQLSEWVRRLEVRVKRDPHKYA